MTYDGYDDDPIPRLRERIKIKMREQEVDFFDYVYGFRPQPLLLKSRFMTKDSPQYDAQVKFDQRLLSLIGDELKEEHLSAERLDYLLKSKDIRIKGFSVSSTGSQ